jgi:hypothetical protein
MFYEVDQAAQANRYFSKMVRYSQIDWSNLDQIVDAYGQRIKDWYLDPAKELATNVHFAFSVMALNCLLIDTLSQFIAGIGSSCNVEFKEFIRKRLPSIYSCALRTTIQHDDGRRALLQDVADVLYHGFRCGILHQAHIPPYGGVDPGAEQAARADVSGLVKYKSSGADCPSVIVNPLKLLEGLNEAFEAYLQELKERDPKNDQLRENFKRKFSTSFGIDISTAA